MSDFLQFLFHDAPSFMPALLRGALVTIELSCISIVISVALGLGVALVRTSRVPVLRQILAAYVEIWRNVPLIVQLLFIYFSLPQMGITLSAFQAAVIGLSLNLAAYLSEVFRAAILSVPTSQWEAGKSIGMSGAQIYRRIIVPQAALVALPTVGGYFISLLKDCALVSFISVNELLREGTIIINATFRSMEVYTLIAFIYFWMSFLAARLVRRLEHALTPGYLRDRSLQ
ncbi:MAG: amino acid ABC transporter permease [Rhizobiaceae bacterium]|nr:amino acid ABC transporter permease [Rhizobiaceae bacterium]